MKTNKKANANKLKQKIPNSKKREEESQINNNLNNEWNHGEAQNLLQGASQPADQARNPIPFDSEEGK